MQLLIVSLRRWRRIPHCQKNDLVQVALDLCDVFLRRVSIGS